MTYYPSIFVVIDPTSENDTVLQRVNDLTKDACSRVHLFLSDYPDEATLKDAPSIKSAKQRFHAEKTAWLEEISKPILNENAKCTYELYWNKDWHEAIPHAAVRRASSLIVKSSFQHTKSTRKLSRTSDWLLIRRCVSPILFVKDVHGWTNNTILAAVNLESADDEHTRLNEAVIQRAHSLAQITGMAVSLVSAVSDKPDFSHLIEDDTEEYDSDEAVVGNYFGIDSSRVILRTGSPKEVILATSSMINADVVIIGSVGRSGIKGAIIGNTAEKILDESSSDILVVT